MLYRNETGDIFNAPDQLIPYMDARPGWIRVAGQPTSAQHELVNIRDFGARGTWDGGTGADDSAAVASAYAYMGSGGGAIYWPPLPAGRYYRLTSPLPNVSGVRHFGATALSSRVMVTAGNLLDIGADSVTGLTFADLGLYTTSGHLIDMGQGDLIRCAFERCDLIVAADDASIVHQRHTGVVGGNFLEHRFIQCRMERPQTSTVPAVDMINNNGAINHNLWQGGQAHSHNCTSSPFFRFEGTSSSTYLFNNRFSDLVGEQNPGGFIHAYTVNGLAVENCCDYDTSVSYVDHVFKVASSASSVLPSKNIRIANSGRWGGSLAAGVYDIWMPTYADSPQRPFLVSVENPAVFPGSPKLHLPDWRTFVVGDNGTDLSVFSVAANDVFRVGHGPSGNRPPASTAGSSAQWYDETLRKMIYSDGEVWRDAMANPV